MTYSFPLLLLLLSLLLCISADRLKNCPRLTRAGCCTATIDGCFPRNCFKWINRYCPARAEAFIKKTTPRPLPEEVKSEEKKRKPLPDLADIRRSQPRLDLARCGTEERHFQPCTTRGIADKLFQACCDLYLPKECHSLCTYETDQSTARQSLIEFVQSGACSVKYLSSILYCASQNRDNRKCCEALDLNSPQLQVGSRCLRMCDPAGTALEKITKDDVTCLYNWNVIMYCHHAGIREM